MLTSARNQYQQQQRLTALGLREARKRASRGSRAVAQAVGTYQYAAASLGASSVPAMLAEQGIESTVAGEVNPASLVTGGATVDMLDKAETTAAFDRLVASLIVDAGRTATSVATAARPQVTGYVRQLNTPSCGRCAVLAGRVYRYSQGFQRHPLCDCVMVPTTEALGADLVTDPMQAFNRGEIRGLSGDDTEAINLGADISQVVNVRRKQAGLTISNSVIERAGRMTPAGIFRVASDRAEAIALLQRLGYLT